MTFGVEVLVLFDTKLPVWYPYYGTWFLGIVAELSLLAATNIHGIQKPDTAFSYVSIVICIFRSLNLTALLILYFGLRHGKKTFDNSDAECQALLSKKLAANGNGYGTTTTSASDETTNNTSDAGSEDSYLDKQKKAKALIEKRLEQDGSWLQYAKGFAVRNPHRYPFD
jgi:hypothetical protein